MNNNDQKMEISSISDIQLCLYYLLREFHNICVKYGIHYTLFGGSMLGAVRHNGIIPWDDDIDVCMSPSDYHKFSNIVNNEYQNDFEFLAPPKENYVYYWGKFCLKNTLLIEKIPEPYNRCMLFIDVFPVFGYPDSEHEKQHFNKVMHYRNNAGFCIEPLNASPVWYKKPYIVFKALKKVYFKILNRDYAYYIQKEIEQLEKYSFESSDVILTQGSKRCQRGKLEKSVFLNTELRKFGNLEVFCLADYDTHLRRLYGDYMRLPPPEKRVLTHDYHLFVDNDLFEKIKEEKSIR